MPWFLLFFLKVIQPDNFRISSCFLQGMKLWLSNIHYQGDLHWSRIDDSQAIRLDMKQIYKPVLSKYAGSVIILS